MGQGPRLGSFSVTERNEAVKPWDIGCVWLGIDNNIEIPTRITASKSFLYTDQDNSLFRDYQNTQPPLIRSGIFMKRRFCLLE